MVSDGGVWGEGDGRRGVGEVVVGRVWGREVVGQGLGTMWDIRSMSDAVRNYHALNIPVGGSWVWSWAWLSEM